jgi:hypothetical protein
MNKEEIIRLDKQIKLDLEDILSRSNTVVSEENEDDDLTGIEDAWETEMRDKLRDMKREVACFIKKNIQNLRSKICSFVGVKTGLPRERGVLFLTRDNTLCLSLGAVLESKIIKCECGGFYRVLQYSDTQYEYINIFPHPGVTWDVEF